MLVEAYKESRQPSEDDSPAILTLGTMLVLAVATSIDALSIGVLFIPVPEVLWLAIGIIAAMSTMFSLIGFWLGRTLGRHLPFNANILGGCILVAIGLKIFIEGFCC
jgi:putative Mn2+ efflux pump MntP